ncbi:MAG: DUF6531 domain-containing protein [Polyangiaceae bacterium]
MPQAAKTFDLVIGIDVHLVMVPSPTGLTPVPLPHPFIGIVWDPVGAAVAACLSLVFGGGPVYVNGLDAANPGTEVKALVPHFPMPPGVSFSPSDRPDNKGAFISGSETVTFAGTSASRTGSMVSSCGFPVNLPTSRCIAVPMGAPTLVGGGEAVNAMAAVLRGIQTKWFSDLLHAILKPGPRLSWLICTLTGHPVDVMTGEVIAHAEDFELPGPLPLKLERLYYSRSRYKGPLGQGWTHSLDLSLTEAEGEIVIRLWDGRERTHDVMTPGDTLWDGIDRYELVRTERDYRLTTWDGIRYTFTRSDAPPPPRRPGIEGSMADVDYPTHRLAEIADRCGNRIAFRYDRGRLAEITDSAGRLLTVQTSRKGHLEGVYFEGRPLVRYTFDAEEMLSSAIDPAGNASAYGYKARLLVRETNRNGLSFHFEYDWDDPDGWCVRTWGDDGIYERTIFYDKLRHITFVDDGRGGRTSYYGARSGAAGLCDRIVDPMGVETRFEWNQLYRKTAEINGAGGRSEWEYDERGNVIRERDPLGGETRRTFDDLNLPVEIVDPGGGVWKMAYDHRGKLTGLTDPTGAERRYEHDARGLLIEATDPLGRKSRFAYSAAGEVVTATDAEGGTTEYGWDKLGRLVRHADEMGRVTKLAYDACGRVIGILRPDESTLRFAYDPEGNLTERTDALGYTVHYRYAGMNKLVEQKDPRGHTVKYAYDVEEDLIAVFNEHEEKYTFALDKAGRVTKEVGFDGRTLLFRYDAAGRCCETVNAEGRIMKLERDVAGRVMKRFVPKRPQLFVPTPAPEVVEYRYDARGDLVFAKNEVAEIALERDSLGRVVRESSNGVTVESVYDASGTRVRRRSSLGHVTDYDMDARGLLRGLVAGTDLSLVQPPSESIEAPPPKAPWPMRLTRDPDGAERSRTMPGSVTARWDRDKAGRPIVQRVTRGDEALLGRGYQWRTLEQLASIIDTEKGPTRYTYDARGFLVHARGPDGVTQHRSPDAIGNLYKTVRHTDRLYGHGGRLQLDGETRYRHDRDGNIVEKIEADGATWKYEWDGAGQLARVTRPDGGTVEFAYDPFGRRVKKTFRGVTTTFVWDGNDLLHELRDAAPIVTWMFEPETFAPLAKIEGQGTPAEKRWGIVTDQIGAPISLVDEVGKLAWKCQLDVFGVASTDVAKTSCPWRWPGQYEDEETGLYYNRFRYYEPELGRYVSQDPIRLAGGMAFWAYVGDPANWLDPFGLESCDKLTRQTRELSEDELNHAFDRHGDQILGHVRERARDFATFAAIVDQARKSGLTFFWSSKTTETIAHLARVDGQYVLVQFNRDGKDIGKLCTAFRPSNSQLSRILKLISRSGP